MLLRRLVLAFTVFVPACARRASLPPLPPLTLIAPFSNDSAMRVIAAALNDEHLPIDGTVLAPAQRNLTSRFRVRPGGLGESTVVLHLRVRPGADTSTTVILFEGTAAESERFIVLGGDNPRDPRQLSGPHPINPNDREVRQKVAGLLSRLATYGIVYTRP